VAWGVHDAEKRRKNKACRWNGWKCFPRKWCFDASGRRQLIVTAYLSNGCREDITEQVRYSSNNPEIVEVSESGVIQSKKPANRRVDSSGRAFAERGPWE